MIKKSSAVLILLMGIAFGISIEAHEPLFGLGPHVPGLFVSGLDVEMMSTGQTLPGANGYLANETEWTFSPHFGITQDTVIGMKIPYVNFNQIGTDGVTSSHGLGDAKLYYKDRFWRSDEIGEQRGMAYQIEASLPTGKSNGHLGDRNYGLNFGMTAGLESLVYSAWISAEYGFENLYSTHTQRLELGSSLLKLGLVYGIRPYEAEYKDLDMSIYLNLVYKNEGPDKVYGTDVSDTGLQGLFVGPSLFISNRNLLISLGMLLPVTETVIGTQPQTDGIVKAIFEWHI